MRYVHEADATLNNKRIETIKYSFDIPKKQKVPNEITIYWKGVLPAPPANDSDVTRDELEYLSTLTRLRTPQEEELVRMVDDDPLHLYLDIAKKYGIKISRQKVKRAWNICSPVVTNLKWQYNRPRPEQIASILGYNIKVMKTDTHQTPAYPSGHTVYAGLVAAIASEEHPEYSSEFYQLVSTVGLARCLQGVHYPTDNDASMVISGALWEDIRHKI